MWLINTGTLELHEFVDHSATPPYAILSHCWGEQEMTFKDFKKKRNCVGPGYRKIVDCCAYARKFAWLSESSVPSKDEHDGSDRDDGSALGLRWLWADTCCIDKSSSSELSEAINSMYAWYSNAYICIAYLQDVALTSTEAKGDDLEQFKRSRWFRRGWTLQELIAPTQVVFLDASWRQTGLRTGRDFMAIGKAVALTETIAAITGIPIPLLQKKTRLIRYSVAQRLSWASRRSTTRPEDMAYCLLGLFAINMPLLYGEGTNAFRRLQHEILQHELGESLFAWRSVRYSVYMEHQLFADTPRQFEGCAHIVDAARRSGPIFSSRGHWVELRIPDSPQTAVYDIQRKINMPSSASHEVVVRLACGWWKRTGAAVQEFVPCVLQLQTMHGTKHLLRSRTSEYEGYFDETDTSFPRRWTPVPGSGTRYILMHSREAEPRRWKSERIIKIEDVPLMGGYIESSDEEDEEALA